MTRAQAEAGTEPWRVTPATLAQHLSGGDWVAHPHLQFIAWHIALCVAGRWPRLMIVAPPRHGKSELTSKWAPLWVLHLWPWWRVILASHTAELAHDFGGQVRDLAVEHRDQLLGLTLKEDSTAKGSWKTTAGGGMVSTGVGGILTGRGAEVLLTDDPTKDAEEARSRTYQRRARRWWQMTARTRLQPSGRAIIINTRWDEDDLTGWLLKRQPGVWKVVRLPAVADHLDPAGSGPADDPMGRALGEVLAPQMWSAQEMQQTREEVGEYAWAALYQGLPVPEEGAGLWTGWQVDEAEAAYAALYAKRPIEPGDLQRIVVGVDPPGGRTDCGIVVSGYMRGPAGERIGVVLEDATVTDSPRTEEWAAAVVEAFHRWNADAVVAETNYGGDMVRAAILTADPSVPYRPVNAARGKRVRAEPVQLLYANPTFPDRPRRVLHAGPFPALRREMTTWQPDEGMDSPNRVDALVWSMTDLRLTQRSIRRAPSPLAQTPRRAGAPSGRNRPGPLHCM